MSSTISSAPASSARSCVRDEVTVDLSQCRDERAAGERIVCQEERSVEVE
jgi:hypothetical protein